MDGGFEGLTDAVNELSVEIRKIESMMGWHLATDFTVVKIQRTILEPQIT